MNTITIITPTYNRAELLRKLYKSLERQTKHDFVWIIVDDGSIDNTKDVVKEIIEEATFGIKYIYKDNGGKHTALNVGINLANSELTMIVDSDDQLLSCAVEEICNIHEKYKQCEEIGAYCFLRCFSDGKPIVCIEREEFIESYIKYRIKENRPGDMAEVFKTAILRKFPFPEFTGERFLSEDVVWIQLGLMYKYVFINKVIYQCEYLDGGLTANDKLIKFASPLGSMMRGKQLMVKECGIKSNIKGAIIFDCFRHKYKGEYSHYIKLSKREWILTSLLKPLGLIFFYKWKGTKEEKD